MVERERLENIKNSESNKILPHHLRPSERLKFNDVSVGKVILVVHVYGLFENRLTLNRSQLYLYHE